MNWNEEKLNQILTTPSSRLIEDMKHLDGDLVIIGAGGKMGPTLTLLAANALRLAGSVHHVTAVSRFTDPLVTALLKDNGISILSADLLSPGTAETLPDARYVIYMAGRKFGTAGQEPFTWAMNAILPESVAKRYHNSHIVVFSSGNIYPMVPISSGGATEETPPSPIGEYGMSCLARERIFEYASLTRGTPVLLYRLNYAVDLRYGVLHDLAVKILEKKPISLSTPCFNIIWQGDANEIALRSLFHCTSPAAKLNVTGPETVSTEYAARKLGARLGTAPLFTGEPEVSAYLNNAGKAAALFGYPNVCTEELLQWQAEWLLSGGRSLGKATHFEERNGIY